VNAAVCSQLNQYEIIGKIELFSYFSKKNINLYGDIT